VARIARRQHGNITRPQLNHLGIDDAAIAHRVARGRLFRVHRGVYAVGRPPSTPLELAAAAVLACGPTAVLSHQSALALWGFARSWPQPPIVTVTGDRRRPDITVYRRPSLARADIRTQLGIRATSAARTVMDCLPGLDEKPRTRLVNDALRSRFLTRSQLADTRARHPRHPGARLLDPFLDRTDGPTFSDLEDEFLAFCQAHGLPRPQVNTRAAGRIVDATFAAERLIVELDSWEFHQDRAAFEDDRERDANALDTGFETIRITSRRLSERAESEAARLHRILARRRDQAA
jgi:Transcriptional regulator, AbiEi antitoxin